MELGRDINFHCRARHCGRRFRARPGRVEPVADREWQPEDYFAICPDCTNEAGQAAWELSLAKGHAHATGPKTPEGRAASAANLAGHPNAADVTRTRFNALRHGLYAETATYWPSRPGQYPQCETCEHHNNGCDDYKPTRELPPACLKKTELLMRYQIAFQTRDPKMLSQDQATLQALAYSLVNDMFLTVIRDGSTLRTPEWRFVMDKEGKQEVAFVKYIDDVGIERTITKVERHPLLGPIIEFMQRNGMTLPDSGMTAKVKDEEETIQGFLQADASTRESEAEFREKQSRTLEGLSVLIERSQQTKKRDPVLLEHQANDKAGGDG